MRPESQDPIGDSIVVQPFQSSTAMSTPPLPNEASSPIRRRFSGDRNLLVETGQHPPDFNNDNMQPLDHDRLLRSEPYQHLKQKRKRSEDRTNTPRLVTPVPSIETSFIFSVTPILGTTPESKEYVLSERALGSDDDEDDEDDEDDDDVTEAINAAKDLYMSPGRARKRAKVEAPSMAAVVQKSSTRKPTCGRKENTGEKKGTVAGRNPEKMTTPERNAEIRRLKKARSAVKKDFKELQARHKDLKEQNRKLGQDLNEARMALATMKIESTKSEKSSQELELRLTDRHRQEVKTLKAVHSEELSCLEERLTKPYKVQGSVRHHTTDLIGENSQPPTSTPVQLIGLPSPSPFRRSNPMPAPPTRPDPRSEKIKSLDRQSRELKAKIFDKNEELEKLRSVVEYRGIVSSVAFLPHADLFADIIKTSHETISPKSSSRSTKVSQSKKQLRLLAEKKLLPHFVTMVIVEVRE